jgi:hypothetical protein
MASKGRVRTTTEPQKMFNNLGRVAYEAYCAEVGGKSVGGEDLPSWEDQCKGRPEVAAAWVTAAHAVLEAVHGRKAQ